MPATNEFLIKALRLIWFTVLRFYQIYQQLLKVEQAIKVIQTQPKTAMRHLIAALRYIH